MSDLIKITIVLAAMLVMLNRKWKVGYVILAVCPVLYLLYLMPPSIILRTVIDTARDPVSFQLLIALSFIRMFEMLLREHKVMTSMMDTVKGFLRNRRAVAVSMPLLIGMMPSVGGAHFSCPMVQEATEDLILEPEDRAFINYWYRHPWEFILPIYPGVVLASVLTMAPVRKIVLLNLPYALTMVIFGILLGLRKIDGRFETHQAVDWRGIASFLPLTALLVLIMGFNLQLHYALVALVLFLMFWYKIDIKGWKDVFIYGFAIEMVVLIVGIMLFKQSLEESGAVINLSRFFASHHIPLWLLLCILPLVSGILTGLTVGFIGSTFPLLLSMPGIELHSLSFAFACGYIGVLLSPVHVCLILTKDYFMADMSKIYRKTIPGVIIIFLIAVSEYLLFKFSLI